MVEQFSVLSGDANPLHVNEQEASKTEFLGRVAHGALLLSFVSRMLGMEIPGKGCLLTNIDARFPKPLKPPDTIHVCGKLTVYNEERKDGKFITKVLPMEKRYSGRFFNIKDIFNQLDLTKPTLKVEMEWYYDISSWDNLCVYLSSEERKKMLRPKLPFFKHKKWNKIGEDEENS